MEENKNEVVETTKTFTQEEVNSMIKDRLDRAEKKWQEKYSNYYSADDLASKTEELNKQITDLGNSLNDANNKVNADADILAEKEQAIADLESKVHNYETDSEKIREVLKRGYNIELAHKVKGDTLEEFKENLDALSPFIAKTVGMPSRNSEPTPEIDGVSAAFLKKNPNIKF